MTNQIITTLIQRAQHSPQAVAFSGHWLNFRQPDQIRYGDLLQRVQQAAAYLQTQAPQCIALRADNCLDWVVVDLAAMYACIPCVPVPMFFSPAQVEHILQQSSADLLIGNWSRTHGEPDSRLERLDVWSRHVTQAAQRLPGSSKITFTSGSTGQPKGVCLSQAQLVEVSCALADAIESEVRCQRHLVILPLSTLLENITGIYVPILIGAESVVLAGRQVGLSGSSQFDAAQFARALGQYQPNSLVLTPALLMALIQVAGHHPSITRTLTFVAVGGARVSPALLQHAQACGIPAFEGYGLSECGSVVTLNTPSHCKAGTSGRVLPHVEVSIADDGEVLVRGNTALGYIGQVFDQSWLPTGDLGALDDEGYLTIRGRKKNQIITAFGRNISPEWIESEAQAWPALPGMVVVGDGLHGLTALLDGQPGEQIIASLNQLNQYLPDYARIHRLVTAAGLKRREGLFTSNGRPVRQQLEHWLHHLTGQETDVVSCVIMQPDSFIYEE